MEENLEAKTWSFYRERKTSAGKGKQAVGKK